MRGDFSDFRASMTVPAAHAAWTPEPPPTEEALSFRDSTWIVVPSFNEEQRLRGVLAELCARYSNVVVVDDGSTDRTFEIAGRYPVWRLRHLINLGQGAALQTGIAFALSRSARYVVTFDADGQHQVEEIESLLEPLREDRADVCLGSRFLGEAIGLPWHRWLTLKLGVFFTNAVSWMRVTDTHNGLRAFTGHACQKIRITQNRMAHASEILDQIRHQGLRYIEVPVTVRYSRETLAKGQSSWAALRVGAQFLLGRLIR